MEFPKHIVAVGGLVTNGKGKVLLMRHPDRGWEFPGGQVNISEDLITALKREVKEETGINISVGKLVGIYQNIKAESVHIPTKIIFDFLCKKVSGGLKTSEESLEVEWFPRDKVLNMITHPVIHDRMKDMLNFSDKITFCVYSKNPYQIHKECYL